MQISSPFRGASPWTLLLLGLFAICLGWSHATQRNPAQLELVFIDAELRVGEPAPAPAADVAEAHASLRALQVRTRYMLERQPHWSGEKATAWLAACGLLPLRLRARAQSTSGDGAESAPHRTIARSWPLPRSSCSDSDPDADAARRS